MGSGAGEQCKPSCINFLSSTKLARTLTYCTDVSLLRALLPRTFEQEHWRYLMLHAFMIYSFHAMKLHRKRPAKIQANIFKESILSVIAAPLTLESAPYVVTIQEVYKTKLLGSLLIKQHYPPSPKLTFKNICHSYNY